MRSGLFILLLALVGCGLVQPKFVNYSNKTGTSGGPSTANATQVGTSAGTEVATETDSACLEVFGELIAPAINDSCAVSGCHAVVAIPKQGGQSLQAGNDARNRAQLLAYSGGIATKLFNKISQNGQSHGGGDKSGTLPLVNIEAWLAKEAECNATP